MAAKNEQELFWQGTFGDEYIARNSSERHLAASILALAKMFSRIRKPKA